MRITLRTITLVGAFMLAGNVTAASAQTPEPSASSLQPGLVAVGGNLSGVFAGAAFALLGGPQITLNLDSRNAIQFRADVTTSRTDYSWQIGGPYSVLYRYTFKNHPDVRAYLVAGAGGGIAGSHRDAATYTTPEHTYQINGVPKTVAAVTNHYDAYTHWDVSLPLAAVVGLGADAKLARRMTMQYQGELAITPYGVAGRASIGLSVALGRVPR